MTLFQRRGSCLLSSSAEQVMPSNVLCEFHLSKPLLEKLPSFSRVKKEDAQENLAVLKQNFTTGFLQEHTGWRSPPGANLLTFQGQCAAAWLIPTSPPLISVLFVMEPGHFIVLITEFSLQRKSEEPEGGFCKFNLQSSNRVYDFVFRPGY